MFTPVPAHGKWGSWPSPAIPFVRLPRQHRTHHPALAAILEADQVPCPRTGDDALTQRAKDRIQDAFR